ncbi:hypothetical protein [Brunnivagina elsteri]|uniref:hypothetical protein n=1 Tax=Brunnivagina elsteri TaxID=1247191 RepID=UPI0013042303|nr:hypothetical protein [Calothrix elsteri]
MSKLRGRKPTPPSGLTPPLQQCGEFISWCSYAIAYQLLRISTFVSLNFVKNRGYFCE